jgi:hypothetical protein
VAAGSATAPVSSKVIVNNVVLDEAQQIEMQRAFGARIPDGVYWYDAMSGAWGYQGGPTAGFTLPGIRLGGMLCADASNGNTGVFINGRELHLQDVIGLRQFCQVVLPGRYWVDAQGNCGYEGGPPLVNLRMLATQSSGGGAWSVNSAFGTTCGDGQGNLFFNDGNTSWSN